MQNWIVFLFFLSFFSKLTNTQMMYENRTNFYRNSLFFSAVCCCSFTFLKCNMCPCATAIAHSPLYIQIQCLYYILSLQTYFHRSLSLSFCFNGLRLYGLLNTLSHLFTHIHTHTQTHRNFFGIFLQQIRNKFKYYKKYGTMQKSKYFKFALV